MTNRTFLSLSDDALKVIEANATERKRGDFVSRILTEYGARQSAVSLDDAGILERIDARLIRIEEHITRKA